MRPAKYTFQNRWTCKFAACFFAVLAMCVSAVSACACTHHQPKTVAEPASCHSASHGETPVVADDQDLSNSIDNGCNCFVSTPVPVVVSKSENKKAATEKTVPTTFEIFRVELIALSDFVGESAFATRHFRSSDHLTDSGPSRAPPRL